MSQSRLRIGFIPEHFSTPLHFAQKHYNLNADLIPFPTGTGALTSALKTPPQASSGAIDIAIGLTEGFVADLGKTEALKEKAGSPPGYGLVGTYVESPLCWAISTGSKRDDINTISDLKGTRVGVSRIGSGSYVMSFVLGDQQNWLSSSGDPPFEIVPIGDFAALRKAVNEGRADFFMWEHFTSKKFWDEGGIKRVGDIYTPWPSWVVAARSEVAEGEIEELLGKLNLGVKHYLENSEEAVEHITGTMHYSREDAGEWMKTVRFAGDVRGVEVGMIEATAGVLRKAGVLEGEGGGCEGMVLLKR